MISTRFPALKSSGLSQVEYKAAVDTGNFKVILTAPSVQFSLNVLCLLGFYPKPILRVCIHIYMNRNRAACYRTKGKEQTRKNANGYI